MDELIAKFAINFGNYEFFSIAIFSLTMIATLSSGNMVKGIIAGVIGFMVSTVGTDAIEGVQRYTFGSVNLEGGFDMLAVMIGLFAVGEIIAAAETSHHQDEEVVTQPSMKGIKGFGFTMKEFTGQLVHALRSALIGMGIGRMETLHNCVKDLLKAGLPLEKAIMPLTSNTADALNLGTEKGHLRAGADADMLFLDDSMEITDVISRGRIAMKNGTVAVKNYYDDVQ